MQESAELKSFTAVIELVLTSLSQPTVASEGELETL
jgi:hypothetical protein